ncbi:hypothetical protein [Tamlana sp. I1]|uniref:hypothetical protein n=1 Tax=Tamlana sp. I1 TaxID=2762061 RepID=UPI00188F4546|nr:hypothetical protein [Tamlana sp. I1]
MTKKTALIIMFFILGIVLIFQLLIFTEQIAYDNIWAGKLNSVEEMKSFVTISMVFIAFILVILFVKYKNLKAGKSNKIIEIFIWFFVLFFTLNTIGNLFAQNIIELILGTFLTLTSAILCFIIVKK